MKRDMCKRTRDSLTASKGEGGSIPPECRAHLETCGECADFAFLMESLSFASRGASRGARRRPESASQAEVGRAFEIARGIVAKRRERTELLLFIAIALAIMSLFVLAGMSGKGALILAIEAAATGLIPLAAIPLFALRLKGEPA